MKVRLAQITDRPFRWQETVEVDPRELECAEALALGEVRWGGVITPTETGHLLRAEIAYEQTLACQRCLAPAVSGVESEVELVLVAGSDRRTAGEYELEEEDLSIVYVEEEEFDTRPILLEQMQLNVPMAALCKEDCAGLCPQCGANRNHETCSCRPPIDPRWEALAGHKSD